MAQLWYQYPTLAKYDAKEYPQANYTLLLGNHSKAITSQAR